MRYKGHQVTVRFVLLIIVFLAFAMFTALTANAATGNIYIKDNADLLNNKQKQQLKKKLLSYYDDVNYMLVTEQNNPPDIKREAKALYQGEFNDTAGNIVIINTNTNQLYLASFDDADTANISTDKLDNITDKVYKYAKKGNYYACADKAFSMINEQYRTLTGVELVPTKTWGIFLVIILGIVIFVLCLGFAYIIKRDRAGITSPHLPGRYISSGSTGGSTMRSDDNTQILNLSLLGFVFTTPSTLLATRMGIAQMKAGKPAAISMLTLWLKHPDSLPYFLLFACNAFAICSLVALFMASDYRKANPGDLKANLALILSIITLLAFIGTLIVSLTTNPAVLAFALVAAVIVICVKVIIL